MCNFISNVIDKNICLSHIYIFYDILADTCFILTQGCLEFQDSILQKQKKRTKRDNKEGKNKGDGKRKYHKEWVLLSHCMLPTKLADSIQNWNCWSSSTMNCSTSISRFLSSYICMFSTIVCSLNFLIRMKPSSPQF